MTQLLYVLVRVGERIHCMVSCWRKVIQVLCDIENFRINVDAAQVSIIFSR